jgi:branched-chain amino acid transport system permease protein
MTTLFTILFDGVAYGMLLFVLACGLAVTLGLMNFVNLAHGAFAMAGRLCLRGAGQSIRLAVLRRAAAGVRVASARSARCWSARSIATSTSSHLDQVLFSVGLVFMSVAAVDYIMGSSRIFIKLPAAL